MLLKGDLRAHKDPWGSHKLRSCHFLRIPSILYIKIDPNDRKLFETQHVIECVCQGYPRSPLKGLRALLRGLRAHERSL